MGEGGKGVGGQGGGERGEVERLLAAEFGLGELGRCHNGWLLGSCIVASRGCSWGVWAFIGMGSRD